MKEFFILHTAKIVPKIINKVVRSVLAKPNAQLELQTDRIEQALKDKHKDKIITQKMIAHEVKKRAATLMKYVNTIIEKFEAESDFFPTELTDFVKILKFNLSPNAGFFYQLVGGLFVILLF